MDLQFSVESEPRDTLVLVNERVSHKLLGVDV